uniref:Uncharacterized protein n=1 Tax=Anguilla anguilla TaxID=7936 RepID=A0A0E9WXJ0_ANGAN
MVTYTHVSQTFSALCDRYTVFILIFVYLYCDSVHYGKRLEGLSFKESIILIKKSHE